MINKRIIVLLIAITLILVAIALTGNDEVKQIDDAYLTAEKDAESSQDNDRDARIFDKKADNLYLVILATKLDKKDSIKVIWSVDNDDGELMQETDFSPSRAGSGSITVSLLKKDDTYEPGKYILQLYLNGEAVKDIRFEIT